MAETLRGPDGRCVICMREYDEAEEICQYCDCPCGRMTCQDCDINLDLMSKRYEPYEEDV